MSSTLFKHNLAFHPFIIKPYSDKQLYFGNFPNLVFLKMVVTLSYFEARGLAEPIRWILAYSGEKFEDVRFPLNHPATVPPEIKKRCTWGQVPLVEFGDGRKLSQSLASTRYLAKINNLVPKDDFQAALCDEYVDACRDFMIQWLPINKVEDKTERAVKLQEILDAVKPRFLDVFNSIVDGNDGKHLVGNTLTWADLYLAHAITNAEIITGLSLLKDLPALQNLKDVVFETPGIKEWLEKRPLTKF